MAITYDPNAGRRRPVQTVQQPTQNHLGINDPRQVDPRQGTDRMQKEIAALRGIEIPKPETLARPYPFYGEQQQREAANLMEQMVSKASKGLDTSPLQNEINLIRASLVDQPETPEQAKRRKGMEMATVLGALGGALSPKDSWQARLGQTAGGLASNALTDMQLGGAGSMFVSPKTAELRQKGKQDKYNRALNLMTAINNEAANDNTFANNVITASQKLAEGNVGGAQTDIQNALDFSKLKLKQQGDILNAVTAGERTSTQVAQLQLEYAKSLPSYIQQVEHVKALSIRASQERANKLYGSAMDDSTYTKLRKEAFTRYGKRIKNEAGEVVFTLALKNIQALRGEDIESVTTNALNMYASPHIQIMITELTNETNDILNKSGLPEEVAHIIFNALLHKNPISSMPVKTDKDEKVSWDSYFGTGEGKINTLSIPEIVKIKRQTQRNVELTPDEITAMEGSEETSNIGKGNEFE